MLSRSLGIRGRPNIRGLDDIPHRERCNIRKADVPLIFATANGEVPCDEVIATVILQLGITRDMHVMKDSPSVISIGRLVIDDGYDFVWKHRDRQAKLISPGGKRHQLWTGNFTQMLPVKSPTTQPGLDSKQPEPTTPGNALQENTRITTPASSATTSEGSRPSWYRGPKR